MPKFLKYHSFPSSLNTPNLSNFTILSQTSLIVLTSHLLHTHCHTLKDKTYQKTQFTAQKLLVTKYI